MNRKQLSLGVWFLCPFSVTYAWADAYDPPVSYYSTSTGTGATLKQQLDNIMTMGQSLPTYGDARFMLDDTDEDPNNPANVLLFYNRNSVSETWVPNSNAFGTREHVWPSSRRPDGSPSNSTRNIGSDLHILKPLDQSTNSSRGNDAFGTPTATGTNGHVGGFYYPGDADKGDAARIIFYGGTRWKDEGLKVVNGTGNEANFEMGDLASLIVWHYLDPPDTFERRRNQMIYGFQGNRNAFIDRPEYAWAVYMTDAMGNSIANDSQLSIVGGSTDVNGASTRSLDLGRVFVGAAVPAAQNLTLNKAGNNGTYFEVTTSGVATSSISGRYNAFRTNQTDSKSITVGLNTNTSTAGLRTGVVNVNNIDVTTGLTGRGSNDANDAINISLTVLDHAQPSFTSSSTSTSLSYDFGTLAFGSSVPSFSFDIFNRATTPGFTASLDFDSLSASGDTQRFSTNLASSAGALSLSAGTSHAFSAMLNSNSIGSFSATYSLLFSDENIAGALTKSLTLTLSGQIAAAALAGDYNDDGVVDGADYVTWRRHMTDATPLPANETVTVGSTDQSDYDAWRANFGATQPGGAAATAAPEPASIALTLLAMCQFFSRARARAC